jgi:hypothetical protein
MFLVLDSENRVVDHGDSVEENELGLLLRRSSDNWSCLYPKVNPTNSSWSTAKVVELPENFKPRKYFYNNGTLEKDLTYQENKTIDQELAEYKTLLAAAISLLEEKGAI